VHYKTFDQLYDYCYHVASVVGLVCIRIFGYRDPRAEKLAEETGVAFQLTNILRDVGEDARRGRIYLPLDEMQRFGVRPADILAARYVPGFVALMQFQAQRARSAFAEALAALPAADQRAQRPGLIMGAIYSSLLEELLRDDFQVLHQHVSLTPIRKLSIAWRTWVFGPPAHMRRSGDARGLPALKAAETAGAPK